MRGLAVRNERGDTVVILLIIIVLLLIGGAGYWVWRHKHGGGSTPTATADCSHLALSQGTSSGAAGTIYKNAVITNNGTGNCTLTGYPAVFMVDGGGTQLGSGAAPNALYAVAAVTLTPGGKAHSVVAFPQQANFNPGTCSALGSSMKMYVPGVVAPLTATWSDYSCPGFTATALQPGA